MEQVGGVYVSMVRAGSTYDEYPDMHANDVKSGRGYDRANHFMVAKDESTSAGVSVAYAFTFYEPSTKRELQEKHNMIYMT